MPQIAAVNGLFTPDLLGATDFLKEGLIWSGYRDG